MLKCKYEWFHFYLWIWSYIKNSNSAINYNSKKYKITINLFLMEINYVFEPLSMCFILSLIQMPQLRKCYKNNNKFEWRDHKDSLPVWVFYYVTTRGSISHNHNLHFFRLEWSISIKRSSNEAINIQNQSTVFGCLFCFCPGGSLSIFINVLLSV